MMQYQTVVTPINEVKQDLMLHDMHESLGRT